MISLLLTLFISLFSYCPSVNTIEDYVENNVVEEASYYPKRSYDIEESRGHVTYYMYRDLLNGDFLKTFIINMPSVLRMGFNEMTLNDYTFTDVGGSFWRTTDFHQGSGIFDVNTLYVKKDSITTLTYQGEDATAQIYQFDYKYDSTIVFRVRIRFIVPYITTNDSSIGIQCYDMSATNFELNGIAPAVIYIENSTNGGYNPLYLYGYVPYNKSNLNTDSYQLGFDTGYQSGVNDGYNTGWDDGNARGYQTGYVAGYTEGTTIDDTASTIFTGILDVALVPVNVFLSIFNFEVFGISIAGVVSGLLTLSVVIIILRFLFGGKGDAQ